MNKSKLFNAFWIFVISSLVGYVVEGIYTGYPEMIWLNHSAVVIGPFNFIYGFGALILTLLLAEFQNDKIWKLFLIGFIGGTIIEYVASWGMELVLGFSAWDYSADFLNINGRVSIMFSFFWGILAVLYIKFLYPRLLKLVGKMQKPIWHKIAIILFIFLTLDTILSAGALLRANARDKGIKAQNKYEEFLDKNFPNKYLNWTYGRHWSE